MAEVDPASQTESESGDETIKQWYFLAECTAAVTEVAAVAAVAPSSYNGLGFLAGLPDINDIGKVVTALALAAVVVVAVAPSAWDGAFGVGWHELPGRAAGHRGHWKDRGPAVVAPPRLRHLRRLQVKPERGHPALTLRSTASK